MPARFISTGRPGRFIAKNDKFLKTEETFNAAFMPHRPAEPLIGPLALGLVWVWSWPARTPKSKRVGLVPRPRRPDLDNTAKIVRDLLGHLGFYLDDGQIVEDHYWKFNGDRPGLGVLLRELPMSVLPMDGESFLRFEEAKHRAADGQNKAH